MRWRLLYLGQWAVFAVHGLLALAYRLLMVLSSNGSLLIVPAVVLVVVVEFHATLHDAVHDFLLEFRPGHVPASAVLDVVLAALVALALLLHRLLARMLSFRLRLIVPMLGMIAVILFRAPLHDQLRSVILEHPLQTMPEPIVIDAILVVLAYLAIVLYRPLSHMLAVVLSTFPTLKRPIRPMRPLSAKPRRIVAVAVRVAVPKPPRWHW